MQFLYELNNFHNIYNSRPKYDLNFPVVTHQSLKNVFCYESKNDGYDTFLSYLLVYLYSISVHVLSLIHISPSVSISLSLFCIKLFLFILSHLILSSLLIYVRKLLFSLTVYIGYAALRPYLHLDFVRTMWKKVI